MVHRILIQTPKAIMIVNVEIVEIVVFSAVLVLVGIVAVIAAVPTVAIVVVEPYSRHQQQCISNKNNNKNNNNKKTTNQSKTISYIIFFPLASKSAELVLRSPIMVYNVHGSHYVTSL